MISDVFRLDTTGSGTGHYVTGAKTFASRTSEIINKDLTAKQTLLIRYGDKDYEFTIDANTTVGALIKQINSSELGKAGVSAYVDDSGRLAFFNPDKDKTITFEDATNDSVNILESLGLDTVTTSPDTSFVRVGAAGKDAKVIFNGVEGSYSTNNFQINGITFTAKKANEEVEITVVQDVDKVVENIKNFVDKYNELISLINGELTEKRYRDYAPLTDEQKKEMKDTEIEKWEQFARSGMLRNDQLLTSALSRMRAALSNAVNSMPEGFRMLADIGITTGSWEERGKLYIDETKLRKAISENPDQVAALFMTNDGVADSDAGDGIAVRMYDQLDQIFKQIVDRAGTATSVETSYSLGKELSDLDDRIEAMQRRLDELQKRYYRQFTAMETYINQMNQQSLWLAQQFGYGM